MSVAYVDMTCKLPGANVLPIESQKLLGTASHGVKKRSKGSLHHEEKASDPGWSNFGDVCGVDELERADADA